MEDNLNDIPRAYLSQAGEVAYVLEQRLNSRMDRLESTLTNTVQPLQESLNRMELKMADVNEVLEGFRAAVEKEFLDDQAQNDLIQILQSNLAESQLSEAEARDLAEAARAGEAEAKAEVDRLLAEIEAATARLGENDIPEDIEVPVEEPVEEPVIEEPAPVEEPVIEEPAPVDEPVIEEPAPEVPVDEPVIEEPAPEVPADEPVIEEPVAGPEVPQEGEPVNPPVDVPADEVPAEEPAPSEGEPAPSEPAPGEAETVDNPDDATGTPPNPFAV